MPRPRCRGRTTLQFSSERSTSRKIERLTNRLDILGLKTLNFCVKPNGQLVEVFPLHWPRVSEMVAIELPFAHVACWKLGHPGRYLTDEEIAIELTQGVAIAAGARFGVFRY